MKLVDTLAALTQPVLEKVAQEHTEPGHISAPKPPASPAIKEKILAVLEKKQLEHAEKHASEKRETPGRLPFLGAAALGTGLTAAGLHQAMQGNKIPAMALAAAGMPLSMYGAMLGAMPDAHRRRINDEVHDPRLYSNLRGVVSLENAKERVGAHKDLDKSKELSVLEAMHNGFTRGGGKHASVADVALLAASKEAAAPKKEKRRPWNVANHRSGKRPMSVSTMLRKEKDGTLQMKVGSLAGPSVPFIGEPDRAAAPRGKNNPDHIPSREGIDAQAPKREDGKGNVMVDVAPGTSYTELGVTNQPQERTASVKIARSFGEYLASETGERHGDIGGLALMAASSADKLKSQLQHPENDQKGSLMGGDVGRSGADLTGLAMMTAPSIASFRHGGSRLREGLNLAGLGALAVPTIDKLQANYRARKAGVDPETKMLLGHKAHAIAELGGYGLLAGPAAMSHAPLHSKAMTLAGYGALAAPALSDLGVGRREDGSSVFDGAGRSAAELAGLGLLGGGVATHK